MVERVWKNGRLYTTKPVEKPLSDMLSDYIGAMEAAHAHDVIKQCEDESFPDVEYRSKW